MENIMITRSNQIKIIDFGVSEILEKGHLSSTFSGTIEYAPHEVLKKGWG